MKQRFHIMLSAARVTLKQHRFEVGAALLGALVVGTWALIVEYRLNGLSVPAGCIQDWLIRMDGSGGPEECRGPMRAWGSVLSEANGLLQGEGFAPVSAMAMLPIAIGLLGGVPIVARELESRTAQTAWSLHGSRLRWLLHQVAPIFILLAVAITFAAFAASTIAAAQVAWGGIASLYLGLHGPLVVVRAFSALGIGLLVGAALGRTLPAFVLGAALSVALLFGAGVARDAWLAGLEPMVIAEPSQQTDEFVSIPRARTTGWGFRTPEGSVISLDEAITLVPPEVAEQDDPIQYALSSEWLIEQGYVHLQLGVTDETALGWAPYDALIFGIVGTVSIGGAAVIVTRRRPT